MRLFPLLALACLGFASAPAQQPWQHLQMPTAAAVQQAWQSPPPEYGPEPYYGLNGPATLATVEHDLDAMHALGYQAVTVQAGYGMTAAYLSPAYFTFFKQFVDAASKRNMRVWIVDDAGYPSGFAGGKFSTEHPELRMQALAAAERIPANAGDRVQRAVGSNTVAVSAINQQTGTSVVVPIHGAAIDFTAPAGSWSIVLVEHRFSTSPTRSDTNPARVKDGSQSLEDYLDPAATAQYLAFTHHAYQQAVGDQFGKTILGFRGDEPDYSIAGLPWTPKFFDRFQQLKGYDIRPYLAAFLMPARPRGATDTPPPAVPLTEPQRRARADYYDVFSQLFRDGFFKPQAEWCAQNHLEYQVHLNHEEMEMQLTRSEGSFFRDMQYVQVPGIDSIWHQIWTDTISDFPRLAASVAHLYGHPRAFTESFAAYRPEPDLAMARYVLNEQFVRGINLVETMYYPSSSSPGQRSGPSKYMRDPGYPALLTYVRRMSYLLSMGRPAATVALYLPSSSLWLGDASADAQFVSAERLLSEHQVDFDIVDEDALAKTLTPGPGTLTTASGNAFRTVLIPNAAVLDATALARLRTFAAGGGKVLFLGRTPTLIAGQTILDARPSTAADFAFAAHASSLLPETPTPPAQPPANPPESMVVPADILQAITQAVGTQAATLDNPDAALRLLHRRLKDADVYLLFNESPTAITHTMRFAGKPRTVEVWDPQTGSIRSPQPGLTRQTVLNLAPYETCLMIVR
jgi:hypothetical protein